MANHPSAIKRIRRNERARTRNRLVITSTRTYTKNARTAMGTSNAKDAEAALREAISALDKAAAKGVIHPNSAARRKSRLMSQYNKTYSRPA